MVDDANVKTIDDYDANASYLLAKGSNMPTGILTKHFEETPAIIRANDLECKTNLQQAEYCVTEQWECLLNQQKEIDSEKRFFVKKFNRLLQVFTSTDFLKAVMNEKFCRIAEIHIHVIDNLKKFLEGFPAIF